MNCFTVLGIEPTTEKKTIKRAYAAKSREFHPEEHPEEFQRIHDAYEEALAWAERNAEERKSHRCLKSRGGWKKNPEKIAWKILGRKMRSQRRVLHSQ